MTTAGNDLADRLTLGGAGLRSPKASPPRRAVTVQAVLWEAAGSPPSGVPAGMFPGRCVVCGELTAVAAAKHVVSDSFMDWDRCGFPNGDGFCDACIFCLKHRSLRSFPSVATTTGNVTHPAGPVDLLRVLSEPVDAATAVIIPIGRQKHVAPFARWGTVRTDNRQLRWGAEEARRLAVYRQARELGVSEAAFREPAPRWPQVKKHRELINLWVMLAEWRADPEFLDVAARATRKPREETGRENS